MNRALLMLCDIALVLGPYVILIAIPLGVTTYARGAPKSTAESVALFVVAMIAVPCVFLLERRARRKRAAR